MPSAWLASIQDLSKVADRLVVKLEGSWRVREYATTGVIWGGE